MAEHTIDEADEETQLPAEDENAEVFRKALECIANQGRHIAELQAAITARDVAITKASAAMQEVYGLLEGKSTMSLISLISNPGSLTEKLQPLEALFQTYGRNEE